MNFFTRYHLFHKRLFFRGAFIILLLLVPTLCALLGIVSSLDSGTVTVCLASEGESIVADEIIESLTSDKGIIRFITADPETALSLVEGGKADTAWIFDKDTDTKLKGFAINGTARHSFVKIYQRSEDISLLLAREKLCAAIFPHLSREVYLSFVKAEVTSALSDGELLAFYDGVMPDGSDLFEINVGSAPGGNKEDEAFLATPLRGILSVLVVLCGMAVSMFYKTDLQKGLISEFEKAPLFEFGYHFAAVFDIGLASLAALYLSGVFTSLGRELLLMLLLSVSSTLFCMIFRYLTFSLELLCALAPLAVVGMLVLSPVFFNLSSLSLLQMLFPPYYYLNAVYNDAYILKTVMYISALLFLYAVIAMMSKRFRRDT